MAASLRDADEQRRRFLADVTHELRTPIAVLQSQIEAQLDGIHPSDEAHLRSLLDETHLLGRLVEDLGTVALADAGRLPLHLESSDPTVVVSDAVEAAASLADDKGVTLAVDAPPAGTPLDLDPTRIRQVVANLLTNAIRHTPAGGQVTVVVRATPGGGASVTVWDTGPGIPPADLDTVFDRYTKAADSGGSGLGLAIARDLVRAHGGSIRATNRVGGGAEITFRLPTDATTPRPTGQAGSASGA
jgi:signal transduction histidine kinase